MEVVSSSRSCYRVGPTCATSWMLSNQCPRQALAKGLLGTHPAHVMHTCTYCMRKVKCRTFHRKNGDQKYKPASLPLSSFFFSCNYRYLQLATGIVRMIAGFGSKYGLDTQNSAASISGRATIRSFLTCQADATPFTTILCQMHGESFKPSACRDSHGRAWTTSYLFFPMLNVRSLFRSTDHPIDAFSQEEVWVDGPIEFETFPFLCYLLIFFPKSPHKVYKWLPP